MTMCRAARCLPPKGRWSAAMPWNSATGHKCSSPSRIFRFRRQRPRQEAHASATQRSEEHTSELQSLMRISYADLCLKKKKNSMNITRIENINQHKVKKQ